MLISDEMWSAAEKAKVADYYWSSLIVFTVSWGLSYSCTDFKRRAISDHSHTTVRIPRHCLSGRGCISPPDSIRWPPSTVEQLQISPLSLLKECVNGWAPTFQSSMCTANQWS